MNKVDILGVEVHRLTHEQVDVQVIDRMRQRQKTFIATVNTEFIIQAQSDASFKDILNQADIRVADGIGLLWAASFADYTPRLPSKLAKSVEVLLAGIVQGILTLSSTTARYRVLPAHITGVDLCHRFARLSAEHGFSLFLLGERPGVAEKAAACLQQEYPNLSIAGTFAGVGDESGDIDTVAQLQKQPADIVLVAYGAPRQEYWIQRNLPLISPLVAMGVGGSFLYISGEMRRAPQLVRRLGLEWLYRLLMQPWRWRRQLALPKFVLLIMKQQVKKVWAK